MNASNRALHGLPKRLVSDALLDEAAAIEASKSASQANIPLAQYLVEQQTLSAYQVASVTAHEFGVPLFDLNSIDITSCPQKIVDAALLQKHLAIPLSLKNNRLQIGVIDPTNHHVINDIRFQVGTSVEPIVVEYDKLKIALDAYIENNEEDIGSSLGTLEDSQLDSIDIDGSDTPGDQAITADEDDAPIVRFVNKLLLDAIKKGASDIHFEPYEMSYRVRFRTDGMLEEVAKPPVNLGSRLAARLKVMSRMDISERRMPQDGRIKMRLSERRAIDFRVNTLPTQYGEKIVLRILDPTSAQLGIEALGYEDDQKEAYLKTLNQPQGMILVTGPTGSGKTVSLYTGLNILNTPERNLSTAEDPIEINLEGINQVQMNARIGLTFSEALRAFLRQDPDVIMVGEIRDLETAEISIKAAQTGHLVLSTLHTNSAPETLTRLLNMGVPAFNVATSVSLIIAQRLARRLCKSCKEPATDIPENILIDEGFGSLAIPLEEVTLHQAVGCKKCAKGYKGRVGIYEVLEVSPAVAKLIMEGGNSLEIAELAKKEGFRTLRQSALNKAAEGIISLEETNRVTRD
ncbi:MAG: type IV-A pilus assembly ATPase PilB [Gammaproteobacteria bacterium]|nr:type IV-A pilus assembly ATPase PilB [Gammaproteobacteria bacterium]MBQ0838302.1 type IV-A pilus assembly ATPase PilB [Gammaproteobacteria bacterium]